MPSTIRHPLDSKLQTLSCTSAALATRQRARRGQAALSLLQILALWLKTSDVPRNPEFEEGFGHLAADRRRASAVSQCASLLATEIRSRPRLDQGLPSERVSWTRLRLRSLQ